ncbi:MAG: hypothetical protein ABIR57_12420 [Aeromicrobium sp.]
MTHVKPDRDAVVIQGNDSSLTYTPRAATLSDGSVIAHEAHGGELSSVWATDLGDCYVEVVFLGDGPHGGELVAVIPGDDTVIVGDLYPGTDLGPVQPSWAEAVDLAVGLATANTTILTSYGQVTRDELDAAHQRLLGVLNG